MKGNNVLQTRRYVWILAFMFTNELYFAQIIDTVSIVKNDNELITWVERYIVKTGYIVKDKNGYKIPLTNSYDSSLIGWYNIETIEKQDFDSISIVLYRLRAGADHNHPIILRRIMKTGKPSEYKVYGRSATIDASYKIFLFFNQYNKFSKATREYCYDMLMRNYFNYSTIQY